MASITIKPCMNQLLENPYLRLHLDTFLDNKQWTSNKRVCKAFNSITLQQRIKSTGVFKVLEVMEMEHFRLPSITKDGTKTLDGQSFDRVAYSRRKVMENLRATAPFIKVFDMSNMLIEPMYKKFFYIIGQKEFQELSLIRFPKVHDLVVRLPKPQWGQFEEDETVLKLTREQIVNFAYAFPNVKNLKMTEDYFRLGNYHPFSSGLEEDEIEALLSLPKTNDEESQVSRLPKRVRTLTLAQCHHPYNEEFSKLLKGMKKLQSISIQLFPTTFTDSVAAQMSVCFEGLPLHRLMLHIDPEWSGPSLDQALHSLSKVRTIKSLDLSGLNVTIEAMKAFASMPSLEILDTTDIRCSSWNPAIGRPTNPYTVEGMKTLTKSNSLTALTMHFWGDIEDSNKLAAMVAILPQMPSLRILDFVDFEFPRNFGESLAKCKNLEELYIKNHNYQYINDEELGKLKGATKLRKIVVRP